jgi:hypothetical protein
MNKIKNLIIPNFIFLFLLVVFSIFPVSIHLCPKNLMQLIKQWKEKKSKKRPHKELNLQPI